MWFIPQYSGWGLCNPFYQTPDTVVTELPSALQDSVVWCVHGCRAIGTITLLAGIIATTMSTAPSTTTTTRCGSRAWTQLLLRTPFSIALSVPPSSAALVLARSTARRSQVIIDDFTPFVVSLMHIFTCRLWAAECRDWRGCADRAAGGRGPVDQRHCITSIRTAGTDCQQCVRCASCQLGECVGPILHQHPGAKRQQLDPGEHSIVSMRSTHVTSSKSLTHPCRATSTLSTSSTSTSATWTLPPAAIRRPL